MSAIVLSRHVYQAYLFYELLVHGDISTRSIESLLQESKQNGDNDGRLNCFSEDDEEHGDGEDIDRHGYEMFAEYKQVCCDEERRGRQESQNGEGRDFGARQAFDSRSGRGGFNLQRAGEGSDDFDLIRWKWSRMRCVKSVSGCDETSNPGLAAVFWPMIGGNSKWRAGMISVPGGYEEGRLTADNCRSTVLEMLRAFDFDSAGIHKQLKNDSKDV